MSMAENNPLRSVPETSKESPVDPSSSTHRERTSAVHGSPERRRNIVILAVIAVVLIAGIFLWRYLSIYESTDDAQVDVHLYPVSARVSGYVVRVNVGDNQWVERGTVLVEIDPKDYGVAIAQAQASLANAQAIAESLNITVPITSVNTSSQLKFTASGIEDANAGVLAAERQLTAAHAQVESAQANDVKAQDDLHRYKLLVDKREIAPQVYDQALASAKSSAAMVAAAGANESAAEQFVQQTRSRSRCRQRGLGCGLRSPMLSKSARYSNRPNSISNTPRLLLRSAVK
jgi:membrane fusion protein (multidrug efflux system)